MSAQPNPATQVVIDKPFLLMRFHRKPVEVFLNSFAGVTERTKPSETAA